MSNLKRFLDAQEHNYADALKEIQNGRKISCWMWYVFPQIQGLGYSSTAQYYAIKDLQEAKDYLDDAVLGARLLEICEAARNVDCNNPYQVFGAVDAMKLKSSMTLFELVAPEKTIFGEVLEKYFNGERDERTVEIINQMSE